MKGDAGLCTEEEKNILHNSLKSGKKCLDPNLKNEVTRSILIINKRFIAHFNQ